MGEWERYNTLAIPPVASVAGREAAFGRLLLFLEEELNTNVYFDGFISTTEQPDELPIAGWTYRGSANSYCPVMPYSISSTTLLR